MKIQLIVTTPGANQGRAIPIVGGKFTIGRDTGCNLRPASPMISKLHCAIIVRDGQIFLQDFGSTNGTIVNSERVQGTEAAINDGDAIQVGPLSFKIKVTLPEKKSASTPLPDALKKTDTPSGTLSATAPASPVPAKTASKPISGPGSQDDDDDIDAAALLLGLGDDDSDSPPSVPEGSTIMEIPAINADGTPATPSAEPEKKRKGPSGAEMSAAANDILRKYIRRTGG